MNDQRCISTNCKAFNYSINDYTGAECTKCWAEVDMASYPAWMGRSDYTQLEVANRMTDEPFRMNFNTQQCELQCAIGYWTNWGSAQSSAADIFDQRCISANCKNWIVAGSNTADTCSDCWNESEIAAYATWDARHSYSLEAMAGRDTAGPFVTNASSQCELFCYAAHYWTNANSVYNKAPTPIDQRCTSANCKDWNHAETFWADISSELEILDADTYEILSPSALIFSAINVYENIVKVSAADMWAVDGTHTAASKTVQQDKLSLYSLTASSKQIKIGGLYNNEDATEWNIAADGKICWKLTAAVKWHQGFFERDSAANKIN